MINITVKKQTVNFNNYTSKIVKLTNDCVIQETSSYVNLI